MLALYILRALEVLIVLDVLVLLVDIGILWVLVKDDRDMLKLLKQLVRHKHGNRKHR